MRRKKPRDGPSVHDKARLTPWFPIGVSFSGPRLIQVLPWVAHVVVLLLWGLWLSWPLLAPDRILVYRDLPRMVLPNLQFVGEALSGGFLPAIQLAYGPGMPFLYDPQTAVWYPGTWVAALAGPDLGFRLHQLVHFFWLGLGFSLIGRGRGTGWPAGLGTGMFAMAAIPHLHGLEWLHITAGVAWVPWSFLAARGSHLRLWVLSLALMAASGHAYLWIMLPVLALAGIQVVPPDARRRAMRCLLMLPLLTMPVWVGYLMLAEDFHPHGFSRDSLPPITAISPCHLLGFIQPRALRDFAFFDLTGRMHTALQWGAFGWSRQCYLGILPLVLAFFGLRMPGKWRRAAVCLILGGFALSMGFPVVAALFPEVGRHIHHPASFIQLSVWGLLLLAGLGIRFVGFSRETFSWKKSSLIIWIPGTLAFLHSSLAEVAIAGAADPLWNFSWRVGWLFYPLLAASLGLVHALRLAGLTGAGRTIIAPLFALCLLALDAGWHARPCVPPSIPQAHAMNPLMVAGEGQFQPENPAGRFFRGGRIAVDPLLEIKTQQPPGSFSPGFLSAFYAFVACSGLPLTETLNGFRYFGDYNPPLSHLGLRSILWHLFPPPGNAAESTGFALDQDGRQTARMLGIRYLLSHRTLAGQPIMSWLAFQNILRVNLYDLGPASEAVLLTRDQFQGMQQGIWPKRLAGPELGISSPIPQKLLIRVLGEVPGGDVPGAVLPGADHSDDDFPGTDIGVFLPFLPVKGWRAMADRKEIGLVRGARFGLWAPLHGKDLLLFEFSPPDLEWLSFAAALGGLGLLWLGRPSDSQAL